MLEDSVLVTLVHGDSGQATVKLQFTHHKLERCNFIPKGSSPVRTYYNPLLQNINQATGGSKWPTRASWKTAWRLPRQKQSKSQRLLRLKKGAEKNKKIQTKMFTRAGGWYMTPCHLVLEMSLVSVMSWPFPTMFTVYCLFALHQDT